ncbi:MAG: hypothetical protein AB7G37_05165 [Solirubrobacteraceae bacterium]
MAPVEPTVPRRRRTLALAAAVALLVGLGASPASAYVVGEGTDPRGDAASQSLAHDILGGGVAYDAKRGTLTAIVRLGERVGVLQDATLTVVASRRTATGCNAFPAAALSATTYLGRTRWHLLNSPTDITQGTANKAGTNEAVQQLEGTSSRLRGQRPDCAVIQINDEHDPSVVYDTLGPIALKAAPLLGVRLRNVPKRMRINQTRSVRVTFRNTGSAKSKPIRLRVPAVLGLKATPKSKTIPALKAGKSRSVTLRVKLTSRARSSTRLRIVTTSGKDLDSTIDNKIGRISRSTGGGGSGSTTQPPRLCNRWIPDFTGQSGGHLGLVPC